MCLHHINGEIFFRISVLKLKLVNKSRDGVVVSILGCYSVGPRLYSYPGLDKHFISRLFLCNYKTKKELFAEGCINLFLL